MSGRGRRWVARTAPWLALGLVAAVALANRSSVLIMLLVPVVLVGALLAWRTDPGAELFGCLIGLAALPLVLLLREPGCLARSGCGPARVVWPYPVAAVVLVVAGLVLSGRRRIEPTSPTKPVG